MQSFEIRVRDKYAKLRVGDQVSFSGDGVIKSISKHEDYSETKGPAEVSDKPSKRPEHLFMSIDTDGSRIDIEGTGKNDLENKIGKIVDDSEEVEAKD